MEFEREAAIVDVLPEDLVKTADALRRVKKFLIPFRRSAAGFHNASHEPKDGQSYLFGCGIAYSNAIDALAQAVFEGDDIAIGRLLGYPECCIKFFVENWKEYKETIPFMNTANGYHIYCNVLLKHLGIRMVTHLPCSTKCEGTIVRGEDNYNLLKKLGFNDEASWLIEALKWPVQWSGLHGAAEITTPLFRTRVDTGYSSEEWKASFNQTEDNFKLNGFSSAEGQRKAHEMIKKVLNGLGSKVEDAVFSAIDLGCGTGDLLKAAVPKMQHFGVDAEDFSRFFAQNHFVLAQLNNYASTPRRYNLGFISVERLAELGNLDILEHADRFVVYHYRPVSASGLEKFADIIADERFKMINAISAEPGRALVISF